MQYITTSTVACLKYHQLVSIDVIRITYYEYAQENYYVDNRCMDKCFDSYL